MDETRYSEKFSGDTGNHKLSVKFDYTKGGFVGINQYDNEVLSDRVLLSKRQFEALVAFVRRKK